MNPRYSGLSQSFHWLTAILVLVAFTLGPGGSEQRVYDASHDLSRQWHESLGLLVLALQHALGNGVATVHTWLGDALLWLAGAHAAAAIAHHALLHDEVLVSMLPHALARHLGRG